ncbi:MAG TPA: glycine cleavage T C-terminal barrel domain-containing protein, partial [Turneriella sp.]|nr:glycine cleavage T C-terminal barrel domain-containing protein [Turneriella sp.]
LTNEGVCTVAPTGATVGEVTSGTFSFTKNYGMGMMRISVQAKANPLSVVIRGEHKPITVLDKAPIAGSVKRRPKTK